ncbi:MAG: regulatory protein RecX [Roseivirga sp.]
MDNLTYQNALQKIAHYCSYQDRTEAQVRAKLRALGVGEETVVEQIVQKLYAERYLDEERYAAAFVRGKFLDKKWGKQKIRHALAMQGIASALIERALATLPNTNYLQTLRHVALQKKQQLTGQVPGQAQQKLTRHLLQKGYEPDLVSKTVQELIAPSSP